MAERSVAAAVLLALLATVFTGACGSVDPGPTAPSPFAAAPPPTPTPAPAPAPEPPKAAGVPAISHLSAVFTNNTCTRAADHLTAMALAITLDFTDEGGVAAGRVELDRRYDTGRTEFHIYQIPAEVTITGGATAGQLQLTGCPLYDDGHTSTETLTLTDAGGLTSNNLSITVTRPAGDP